MLLFLAGVFVGGIIGAFAKYWKSPTAPGCRSGQATRRVWSKNNAATAYPPLLATFTVLGGSRPASATATAWARSALAYARLTLST